MTILFYFFYNLLLVLALPFILVGSYFNEKLGSSLSGQKDIKTALEIFNNKIKHKTKPVIWLHAASAGEFEQIKPFLSRLKLMDVYLFQTFSSPTIFYKVSHSDMFDGACFLPWDLYPRVNRFISKLKPQLFINTRHDIWPNLQLALHKNGIRNILVNANLYPDSQRLKPWAKAVNRVVFDTIDHIYTGSQDLKSLLELLYSGPIDIVGDSRFDQVLERSLLNNDNLIPLDIKADRKVIIYGSVVTSDLKLVSSAIARSLSESDMLHVIVPHEVTERDLVPWESELYRHQVKSIRHSELEYYKHEPVLIWNNVGQLADLYKQADLAYIGAGFSTGVHSVTEAAIYHIPAAHGPNYCILAEAVELVNHQLSTVVQTDEELANFLMLEPATARRLSEKIALFVKDHLGATEKVIKKEFSLNT